MVEGLAKNQNVLAYIDQNDPGYSSSDNPVKTMRVWNGRSSCNRVVNFITDSPRNFTGQLVPIKINRSTSLALSGELDTANGGLQ